MSTLIAKNTALNSFEDIRIAEETLAKQVEEVVKIQRKETLVPITQTEESVEVEVQSIHKTESDSIESEFERKAINKIENTVKPTQISQISK